jgi:hypothetical protein
VLQGGWNFMWQRIVIHTVMWILLGWLNQGRCSLQTLLSSGIKFVGCSEYIEKINRGLSVRGDFPIWKLYEELTDAHRKKLYILRNCSISLWTLTEFLKVCCGYGNDLSGFKKEEKFLRSWAAITMSDVTPPDGGDSVWKRKKIHTKS